MDGGAGTGRIDRRLDRAVVAAAGGIDMDLRGLGDQRRQAALDAVVGNIVGAADRPRTFLDVPRAARIVAQVIALEAAAATRAHPNGLVAVAVDAVAGHRWAGAAVDHQAGIGVVDDVVVFDGGARAVVDEYAAFLAVANAVAADQRAGDGLDHDAGIDVVVDLVVLDGAAAAVIDVDAGALAAVDDGIADHRIGAVANRDVGQALAADVDVLDGRSPGRDVDSEPVAASHLAERHVGELAVAALEPGGIGAAHLDADLVAVAGAQNIDGLVDDHAGPIGAGVDVDYGRRPGGVDRLLDGDEVAPAIGGDMNLAGGGAWLRRHHHRHVHGLRRLSEQRRENVAVAGGGDDLVPIGVAHLADHLDLGSGGQRGDGDELGARPDAHIDIGQRHQRLRPRLDLDRRRRQRGRHGDAALLQALQAALGQADKAAIGELLEIVLEIGRVFAVLDGVPEGEVVGRRVVSRAIGGNDRRRDFSDRDLNRRYQIEVLADQRRRFPWRLAAVGRRQHRIADIAEHLLDRHAGNREGLGQRL